jgi:asparagine synthetase B (glutamine-hydrolysing)
MQFDSSSSDHFPFSCCILIFLEARFSSSDLCLCVPQLKEQYGFNYETNCDVECILHLYAMGGIEHCARSLDGVFVFCIVDSTKRRVFVARDPYGVRPLFYLNSTNGVLGICSEAKG